MPVFEMPLEQLRSYRGRTPRPADFDEYWHRGLRELDSTDPQPEFVAHPSPAGFAECFDLWFTGVSQARIHAKYIRPRASGPYPALLAGSYCSRLERPSRQAAVSSDFSRRRSDGTRRDDPSRGRSATDRFDRGVSRRWTGYSLCCARAEDRSHRSCVPLPM